MVLLELTRNRSESFLWTFKISPERNSNNKRSPLRIDWDTGPLSRE